MAFWLVIGVLAVVVLVASIFLGGWFFLLLFAPIAIAIVALLVRGGASPARSREAREARPELLGPGGPDDPDRA